jgi:hypothetical protein
MRRLAWTPVVGRHLPGLRVPSIELEGERATERDAGDVWTGKADGSDESGQAVGVIGHEKVARRIRGAPAARSVPGDDGELVGEALELPAPLAAVGYPAVQQEERRPLARLLESDAEVAYPNRVHLAQANHMSRTSSS